MSPLPSRRSRLHELKVAPSTHAGLWLDKYAKKIQVTDESLGPDGIDPRQLVLEQAAGIAVPPLYISFFQRWRQALLESGATCRMAHSQGRIAIGLGNESVQETAITLHRTYGVPYLPGSALKGLAAHFAAQRLGPDWHPDSKDYCTVFGDSGHAGYITFFDAYPDPTSGPLLRPDIMAIHHPRYYQGEGAAPADWDDPSLVPFPTATGRYLVALGGPPAEWAQAWVDVAFQILGFALQEAGIGAKTSAGYGRMRLDSAECTESSPNATVPAAAATMETAGNAGESYAQARRRLLAALPPQGRQRGTVARVIRRPEGGVYGFITPAGGGGDIHVYQDRLAPPGELREQQIVEFALPAQKGGNKRPSAEAVVVLREPDI